MAKAKKEKTEQLEQPEQKTEVIIEEITVTEELEIAEPEIIEPVEEKKQERKQIYIPDIPAQMIEETEPEESDEALFLRNILRIQNNGGFGTHLNKIINDRIKELKNG